MMTTIDKIDSVVMITKPHSIRFENGIDGNEMVIVPVTHNLMNLLKKRCREAWPDFRPKECTSFGSDYAENYESDMDRESSCSLGTASIKFWKPDLEKSRVYTFHKAKMQSLMYDLLGLEVDE